MDRRLRVGATAYAKKSPYREDTGYRNYYCHAVLMAFSQTGAAPGGSPIIQFALRRLTHNVMAGATRSELTRIGASPRAIGSA